MDLLKGISLVILVGGGKVIIVVLYLIMVEGCLSVNSCVFLVICLLYLDC